MSDIEEKEEIVLTHQEAFNLAVRGMKAQGWRKAAAGGDWVGGACKYRTTGGLKCAIGHIIPDDRYVPGMEGDAAFFALNTAKIRIAGVDVWSLQVQHDSALDRLHMLNNFRQYAAQHGLEFPADCLARDAEMYPQISEPA